MPHAALAIGAVLGVLTISGCGDLPPLLRDAQLGFNKNVCRPGPHGGSPDLNLRLEQQFPPGTPEVKLLSALREQGFELKEFCKNDRSIRSAFFRKEYIAHVKGSWVHWKVDDKDTIVWTTGSVSDTGGL